MISASCDSPELLDLEEIMPWAEITRPDYDRRGLRYASDCTDSEWALIEPFMPERSKVGRPCRTRLRAEVGQLRHRVPTQSQRQDDRHLHTPRVCRGPRQDRAGGTIPRMQGRCELGPRCNSTAYEFGEDGRCFRIRVEE